MRPKTPTLSRREVLKTAVSAALTFPFLGAAATAVRAAETAVKKPDARGRSTNLKLGVASFSLSKSSVEDLIAVLQQLKIENVSLYKTHVPWADGSPEQCRAVAEKFKLAGITVTGTGVVDFTNDEATARKAFDNDRAAGVPLIVGHPLKDALPLVDRLVKEYDIKVAIHNHGPSDLYGSPFETMKVLEPFDQRLGVCLDVGHGFRAGIDPVEAIHRCRSRLLDLHIKDTAAPVGGPTKDPAPVVIGRGRLDIRGILTALLETKYTDVVGFEYEESTKEKVAGLAECVGYIRGMLAASA